MRGASRSGPKFLAVFSKLDWRRLRPEKNPWPRFPVLMRGVFRAEANFLALFPSLDAWRFSVRTKVPGGFPSLNARLFSVRTEIPGDVYPFGCLAFFGQDQNSWRRAPVQMRGVLPPEPKFPPVCTNLDARRFSVRTRPPSDISQVKCEASVDQDQSSLRYSPVSMRCVFGQNQTSWQPVPV